jgi:hypothetical protein
VDEPATAKQKAFLSYMGVSFPANLSKQKAALMVNDAMDSPRDAARVARWSDERLRLHPDIFAADVQAKRENRSNEFHARVQKEGAKCFENVSKAHCQVLVSFLDVKFPNWDANEREATWDYFFPALAEKFPQLVTREWRGKIKYPTGPKVAEEVQRMGAMHVRPLKRSTVKRAVLVLVLIGIAGGGAYAWHHPALWRRSELWSRWGEWRKWLALKTSSPSQGEPKGANVAAATNNHQSDGAAVMPELPIGEQTATSPESEKKGAPSDAGMETGAPAKDGKAKVDPVMPTPDAPAIPVTPTSGTAGNTLFNPSPATPKPATPARTSVMLTKPVQVQLTYGRVTLSPGVNYKLVSQEGNVVKLNYLNTVIEVPISSTNLEQ